MSFDWNRFNNEKLKHNKIKHTHCEAIFNDGYLFYKIFEALLRINSLAYIKINTDNLEVYVLNNRKTHLMRVLFRVDSSYFIYNSSLKLTINLEEFVKLLKCNKNDKNITSLYFKKDEIQIKLESKVYKSLILRNFKKVDFFIENEDILDKLINLTYVGKFELEKEKFIYLITQLERFSKSICLDLSNTAIIFKENNHISNGEIKWNIEELTLLNNNSDIEKVKSYFSINNIIILKHFLFGTSPKLKFFINSKIPIKIKIKFPSLGNSYGLFFLAQRESVNY
ncbi:MAG: hypothetical protein CEE42_07945 [Promethearchaeota archaeon Loki_b31]|nr:MAG: hypothetical protein CEE42_07945 [Candidatus Lokiarchaeota archaeon Loki_b31]